MFRYIIIIIYEVPTQKIKMAASIVDVFVSRSFSVSPSLFKGNNYSIRRQYLR